MSRPNLYDYLKIIAILTMIVDHVGFFFFPEALWMRLIWRIAFPIFLFLVGFSGKYKRRRDIFIRAIIIQIPLWILYFGYDYGWATLNILRSIIFARFLLSKYTKHNRIFLCCITIFILSFQISLENIFDYGSFALLFPAIWYLFKTQKSKFYTFLYSGTIFSLFRGYTTRKFGFSQIQQYLLAWCFILLLYVFFLLWQENRKILIKKKRDALVLRIAKKALLIYIIHLWILSGIKVAIEYFKNK